MRHPMLTGEYRREYHERLLVVKTRESAAAMCAVAAAGGGVGVREQQPIGLAALSALERSGMIKGLIPLAGETRLEQPHRPAQGAMTALASIASQPPSMGANAGVALIEVARDEDVAELQLKLGDDRNIDFVARVPVRYLTTKPKPPATKSRRRTTKKSRTASPLSMWNLHRIQWEQARSLRVFKEAAAIKVAVFDTGVDADHAQLQGRVDSYIHRHPHFPDSSSERDVVGHGTHVAGVIAADSNPKVGIKGLCRCQLAVWKIFGDQPKSTGSGRWEYVVDPFMYHRALAACADEGIHVVNLSIGGPAEPDFQEAALFSLLMAKGCTVIAAMGNEREFGSPTFYPAATPGVVAVGATSIDDTVANFSSQGSHISLTAPGVAIWSTLPTYPGQLAFESLGGSSAHGPGIPIPRETHYGACDGTSMAAPHVTGATALLLAKEGEMSGGDVRRRLMATADRVSAMGKRDFDPDYGAGRLNVLRLLTDQ